MPWKKMERLNPWLKHAQSPTRKKKAERRVSPIAHICRNNLLANSGTAWTQDATFFSPFHSLRCQTFIERADRGSLEVSVAPDPSWRRVSSPQGMEGMAKCFLCAINTRVAIWPARQDKPLSLFMLTFLIRYATSHSSSYKQPRKDNCRSIWEVCNIANPSCFQLLLSSIHIITGATFTNCTFCISIIWKPGFKYLSASVLLGFVVEICHCCYYYYHYWHVSHRQFGWLHNTIC